MTRQEFIRKIIEHYHNARQSLYPHVRVFRGGSRSIASETEDIFASYLIDKLSPSTIIYLNQTITPVNNDTLQCIKPDLVIVKDGLITGILDLKMDLGYKRDKFAAFWRERDERVNSLRNQRVSVLIDVGGGPRKQEFMFGGEAKLFFVLVSDRNISKKKLDVIRQIQETVQASHLVVLTRGEHPNVYGLTIDEAFQRITINHEEFSWLEKALKPDLE
jgi:hypothetical protein